MTRANRPGAARMAHALWQGILTERNGMPVKTHEASEYLQTSEDCRGVPQRRDDGERVRLADRGVSSRLGLLMSVLLAGPCHTET